MVKGMEQCSRSGSSNSSTCQSPPWPQSPWGQSQTPAHLQARDPSLPGLPPCTSAQEALLRCRCWGQAGPPLPGSTTCAPGCSPGSRQHNRATAVTSGNKVTPGSDKCLLATKVTGTDCRWAMGDSPKGSPGPPARMTGGRCTPWGCRSVAGLTSHVGLHSTKPRNNRYHTEAGGGQAQCSTWLQATRLHAYGRRACYRAG
nr:uncharacterized protein LOC109729668 isoform X1 [Microcebus murinus]